MTDVSDFVRAAVERDPDDRQSVWSVAADYLEEVGRVGGSLACRWVARWKKYPIPLNSGRHLWLTHDGLMTWKLDHSLLPTFVARILPVKPFGKRYRPPPPDSNVAAYVGPDEVTAYLDVLPSVGKYLSPTLQESRRGPSKS